MVENINAADSAADIDSGYLQVLSVANIIPVLIHSSMWTVYGLNVTNNKLKQPALVLILTGAVSAVLSIALIRLFDMTRHGRPSPAAPPR